jgi:hypothetical protein
MHSKKSDQGTFGLLKCLQRQEIPFKSLYQICHQRTDSRNGRILYKIGQGHIFHQFGQSSDYQTGISFLEQSISKGYRHAIR